jgi:uroporphyrinogen decarboxylase
VGYNASIPQKELIQALNGETVDQVPIWLMRQAGRYLPEYRKIRAEVGSFLDLCYTPELAEEVTLQPIRRFGFNASILFSDILVVLDGLGQKVSFIEGQGPVIEPLTRIEELQKLNLNRMIPYLEPVYETVRRLRRSLPTETALIGFAGAPWTIATYLVGGRGSLDQRAAKIWAYRAPDEFQKLITLLSEATVLHLAAQAEAGAEVLQVFDTWAEGLPEQYFRRFCLEPMQYITAALKTRFPSVPIIGFPRGAELLMRDYFQETKIDGLSLSTGVPLAWVKTELQPLGCVQGNLDPLLLVAGGLEMQIGIEHILNTLGQRPFIFNLGHGVLPQTPLDHVVELIDIVRNWRF